MKTQNLQNLIKQIKGQKEIVAALFIAVALSALTTFIYFQTPTEIADSTSGNISVDTAVDITNGFNADTAYKQSTIDWRKEVKPTQRDVPSSGYVIERIDVAKQDYVRGSLQLPDGWTVQYSTSAAGTPENNIVWQSTEPPEGQVVTFLKLSTGDRDSFKPGVQTSLLKPLSNVKFDRTGYRPSKPILYNRKLYQVMMAVNIATSPSKYTLDCFDLETFLQCTGYPKYLSSTAGTTLSSSQVGDGVSTPMNFEPIIDEGQYGNEGRMYMPAQQGNNYGINCIDLRLQQNCGFTVMGASTAPTGTVNPALIAGFVQKDDRLYGHANDADKTTQTMVCFDLDLDGQGTDGLCPEYNSNTVTTARTYEISEHYGNYRTPGSHVLSGDRIYWQVNYAHAMIAPGGVSYNVSGLGQAPYGYALACFDVIARTACGTPVGGGTGFNHPLGASPTMTASGDNLFGKVRGYGSFVWKKFESNQYVDNAICTMYGMANGANPDIRCFNKDTGVFISTVGSRLPPNLMPNPNTKGWLLYPWSSAPNITTFTGSDGNLKSYFPMYSTFHESSPNPDTLNQAADPDATIKKGGTICYDWKTQAACPEFGNAIRYWHDINDGNSADVGYVNDGECTWAAGLYGDIWSFNSKTGEYPCRSSKINVDLKVAGQKFHCDGVQRAFTWDRVRLAQSSMFNYESFNVIVKNAQNGNVIKQGDIKANGFLDISDIAYAQNTELDIDVVPTILNTTPWANGNKPLVSGILNADEVQYCYKTKVKDKCNIKDVATSSLTNVSTETDTLASDQASVVPVNQPANVQCFQDLRAAPSLSKDRIPQDETFSYSVAAENKANKDPANLGDIPSSENASTARIEISLPAGVEYVSASPAGATRVDNKVIWENRSVPAAESRTFTVNLKSSPTVASLNSARPLANVLYAATVEQPAVIQSTITYSGDNQPSDNTSSTTVTLVAETTEEPAGGVDEEPRPEDFVNIPLSTGSGSNGPTGPDGRATVTPSLIRNILPPRFADQAEQFFKIVNSAIQPIPSNVAVAIPYASIAFLGAFAVIYLYQGIQEANSRRRLLALQKRYKRTDELRKNYIDMTSHYLNTPIAKMQTTLDYLVSTKSITANSVSAAKQRIARLNQHAKMLLGSTEVSGADSKTFASNISKRSSLFGPGTLVPMAGVLLVTLIINALFVWADKYDATVATLVIQSSFYVLSAAALFVAYNRFRTQKYATEATVQQINLEKQLTQSQSNFIANSSKTLEDDLLELDHLATTLTNVPKSEGFTNGVRSLKDAVAKLGYLNSLTSHAIVPTIPNQTIKDLAYEVINSLKAYADERHIGLDVVIEPGLTVLVDIDGFKQLLESTVHNAIKFSNPSGNVDVNIARHDKDNVKITVKDNGAGIPKDKLGQIFEPFGRATDSKQYDYEGIGLDLYMDKLIAEQCGGSIAIDSATGKGTTVTIILPS